MRVIVAGVFFCSWNTQHVTHNTRARAKWGKTNKTTHQSMSHDNPHVLTYVPTTIAPSQASKEHTRTTSSHPPLRAGGRRHKKGHTHARTRVNTTQTTECTQYPTHAGRARTTDLETNVQKDRQKKKKLKVFFF